MDLRLPNAPEKYDAEDQAQLRRTIEQFARSLPYISTMRDAKGTFSALELTTYAQEFKSRLTDGTFRRFLIGASDSGTDNIYLGQIDTADWPAAAILYLFGKSEVDVYVAGVQTARFTQGTMTLLPQDGTSEGGQITLTGAAAFRNWSIDTVSGLLRFFSGGTVVAETDLTTWALYVTKAFVFTPIGDTTGLTLMRGAADNMQIRSNDNGQGAQQDASKVSWALAIGEAAANDISFYQRPAGGGFTQQFAVDMSATADDIRLLVWDVTAAAIRRVSRGAIGSGGVGFRLLRIVN